jgi:sugar/nucleoside kinase (ribokinase family)
MGTGKYLDLREGKGTVMAKQDGKPIIVMGGLIRDIYLEVRHYPERGTDTLIKSAQTIPGGCALNAAVTLKNLGLNPHIVSLIGDGIEDQLLINYIRQKGLPEACILRQEGAANGFSINIIDDEGERTFLTRKGSESVFRPMMISDRLMGETPLLYLTGYYLQEAEYQEPILNALKRLRDGGARILFDPGALVENIGKEVLTEILKLAFCITPNEGELKRLGTCIGVDNGLISHLLDVGVELVVRKEGMRGVTAYTRNETLHVWPYAGKRIDTTGAGDAFASGLLYGFSVDAPLKRSLQIANGCGSLATRIWGPHGNFSLDDVELIVTNGKELRV